jgi:carboxypeptidase Taq
MQKKLLELKEHLREIHDLEAAAAMLGWDQLTYMPSGGAEARGRQIATLERLAHEKFTAAEIGNLLDELDNHAEELAYESFDASLIRLARRMYDRDVKVPADFITEYSEHMSASYAAWANARPSNDFKATEPFLEKTLELSRQMANYFNGYDHIADPLIEYADYGFKTASIRSIFGQLREQLVPLVEKIRAQPPADDSFLKQSYNPDQQINFGAEIIKQFGFDFERGRQDMSPHPFTTEFSIGDVRITTRVKDNNLHDALFSTLHEAGHGMYEQGINPEFEGTHLARGASSGVHESQSRLWENIIGRNFKFWNHFYPTLQTYFPAQLGKIELDAFYRAINKVEPSLIRTDADEVTYNLHVMMRFDFEIDLLEGNLSVKDLPDAWNARIKSDLGVEPPDDRDGVLQDVHWYAGRIGGMFQGYTLGNILSAQFFEKALNANPSIEDELQIGKFDSLHTWLRENIYHFGKTYSANELVEKVCSSGLQIDPYIRYLTEKYGQLYQL